MCFSVRVMVAQLLGLVLLGAVVVGATISGVVSDSRGKVQGTVIIVFTRTTMAEKGPQTGVAVVGEAGAFRFEGLAAGTYALCVQGEKHDYLDKCAWSMPQLVQVKGDGDTVTSDIALEAGVRVQVQLQDPKRVLKSAGRAEATGQVSVGIGMKNGMFRTLSTVTHSDQSATWEAVLPVDDSFQLHIETQRVRLKDKAGNDLRSATSKGPVLTPISTKKGVPNILVEYLADMEALP